LLLEFGEVSAERVELFTKGLELWRVVVLLESLQNACGVAVERLAGEALLVGAAGDVAVRAFEDSGGIGDTELRVFFGPREKVPCAVNSLRCNWFPL
jgi:hypothetical protein